MTPWLAARNLLAVRLDNAGDVVMLGPALQAIKAASPEARITLLCSPAGALAAPLLPWVDETIVWRSVWQDLGHLPFDPDREFGLVATLRDRRFDAALVFTSFSQTPHTPGYVCYLAGIPLRAGESKEFGGAVLTTELRGAPDELHQVERNLRLVEAVGFPVADRSLAVVIPDAANERARSLLAGRGIAPDRPWLLLHPGASAAARRYPAERWGEAARLLGERGWPVLVSGVEKERPIIEAIVARAPAAAALVGETTMAEYAALVASASVILCGNTLPLHLADACRTPVVVLFAGTDLVCQWAPRDAPARLLRRDTACTPCYRFDCPIGQPCLDVAPGEVAAAVEAVRPHPPAPSPQSRERERRPARVSSTRADQAHADRETAAPAPPLPRLGSGGQGVAGLPRAHPRRIAVVQALGLGDFLCLTPALRALRTAFPGAEINLIGSPWAEEAIRRSPLLDRFVPFPGWPGIAEWPVDADALAALFAEARANPYDLALQCHGSGAVSNGFVAALGAARSVGYATDPGDSRLAVALPWREDEPEPRRWLRLAEAAGAPAVEPRLEFPLLPTDRAGAADLLARLPAGDGPVVLLHPGAKDPTRRWPAARFAELARRLAAELGARLALSGGPGERPLTAAIAANAPALDLAGETDLGTLAALIAGAELLVTNDTGTSHLAAAAGTPSVVLFGPSRPGRWAPLDADHHTALDATTIVNQPDGAVALAWLPVEPVFAASRQQLVRFSQPARPAVETAGVPA